MNVKTIKWGGRDLIIETGKMAKQANGSVVVRYGDTVVLATAVGKKDAKKDVDFFPLTVNYLEKFYADGRIPGGFFKRESKPSKRETLISRLIDRPIRPMFPEGFFNEVQIQCTVFSYDKELDADIAAFVGASAALYISDIPFADPICASKVAKIDGKLILNPTASELKKSKLDLTVAGTEDSILMIESAAHELSEGEMLEAVQFGHKGFAPVLKALKELQKESGKEKWPMPLFDISDLQKSIKKDFGKKIEAAYKISEKSERIAELDDIMNAASEKYQTEDNTVAFAKSFKSVQQEIVRAATLKGKRIDGRKPDAIRNITCDVNLLPRVHGSAMFTRGGTQALAAVTFGTDTDAQSYDDLGGDRKENFMLHYNFPPFSVGECGMLRAPGRREIGHGELALKGIKPVLAFEQNTDFLYPTVRVVSEILESDGSSSMATVCATSLALMSSGVPTTSQVAGIAMGLIKEKDDFTVISDITGEEDSLGDMDFKVVGTELGVTALQMDIKIRGISVEIMKTALEQAKHGRLHILSIMNDTIASTNIELNKNAPVIRKMKIDPDRIREIIGSGGKNIKHICEVSQASIDINDDGTLLISCASHENYSLALEEINKILSSDSRRSGGRREGESRNGRGDRSDRRHHNRDGDRDREERSERRERSSDRGDNNNRRHSNRDRNDRNDRNDRGNRSESSPERGNERSEKGRDDNRGNESGTESRKKRFKFF